MNNQTPTAQSGPSDLDRLIRVGDLPAPITNPEAWPTGYADGFNDYARMVVQTAPTQSTPAGARDTVADVEKFADWLAREIPPGTTISNPYWWAPRIIRALEALTGKADGGGVVIWKAYTTDGHLIAESPRLAFVVEVADIWHPNAYRLMRV